jgi:hypothetical protein
MQTNTQPDSNLKWMLNGDAVFCFTLLARSQFT